MYLSNNQKVSQSFGGSESSWENNGVEVILLQHRQSLHFTSCYSRWFHQNVPVIDMNFISDTFWAIIDTWEIHDLAFGLFLPFQLKLKNRLAHLFKFRSFWVFNKTLYYLEQRQKSHPLFCDLQWPLCGTFFLPPWVPLWCDLWRVTGQRLERTWKPAPHLDSDEPDTCQVKTTKCSIMINLFVKDFENHFIFPRFHLRVYTKTDTSS